MTMGARAHLVRSVGTVSVAVTFQCPDCNTTNVTPVLTAGVDLDVAPTIYGAVTCSSCGKQFLASVSWQMPAITVQQVN